MIKTICICADNYPTKDDPTHSFVEQLAMAISITGIKVIILAPQTTRFYFSKQKHPVFRKQKASQGNIITIYQPVIPTLGLHFQKYNKVVTNLIIKILLLLIPDRPDVFYGHFWGNAYMMYRHAKRYKKPLFVATGESVITFGLKSRVPDFESFIQYLSGIICVSSKNKEESIRIGLTDGTNCCIIPNAINEHVFRLKDKSKLRTQYGYNQDDFIVAFLGWMINRKGPQRVSEAIKLCNTDIKSFFIGSPSKTENVIPDCEGILFKGPLSHDEVSDYFNMADVFVLPTLNEGCCNAIVEALACGLPVISSDRPFNYDILDQSNSILVNPEDIDQISSAILTLKEDEKLRKQLSEGAIKKAQELSIKVRSERIISFIENQIAIKK